jgi:hypothetical protein
MFPETVSFPVRMLLLELKDPCFGQPAKWREASDLHLNSVTAAFIVTFAEA